ncbi:hypothetical protein D9Y22_11055 [Methylorubrum sp. DB1722]|nr:hypothetical protein [Methylorubrum sp. DB1722]
MRPWGEARSRLSEGDQPDVEGPSSSAAVIAVAMRRAQRFAPRKVASRAQAVMRVADSRLGTASLRSRRWFRRL